MELFHGSLLKILQDGENFDLETKIAMCRQVSAGVWHLHGQNVLHCDIALR